MITAATIAALRTTPPTNDAELKESLSHGWWPDHPAIQDENGLTLIGNRRLKFAKELGIEPVIKTVAFGAGEEADDQRIRRAYGSNQSAGITPEDRKAFAISLYSKENWTQERIAKVLKVSQPMVSKYLEDIYNPVINVGGRGGLDSLGRKKAPGRPKKPPRPRKYSKDLEEKAAKLVLDGHKGVDKVAAELGVSAQVVITSKAREVGRREALADPEIERAILSMSAQEKLDAAIRQHKKKLEQEFNDRLRMESLKRDEVWLKQELELFDKAKRIESSHRGVMSKAQYRDLQRCLHTDVLDGIAKQGEVDPVTRKRFDHALGVINDLELVLVKDDAKLPPRPSFEELMRRRAEVFAKRSAQSKANAAKRSNRAQP